MSLLTNFTTSADFWKLNPQFLVPEEFRAIYDLDKSKDKKESSTVMWAIALLVDSDSKFLNLNIEDRKVLIAKDYLKNPKFDWGNISLQKAVEMYKRMELSPAQRAMQEWNNKIEERQLFLKKAKYNEDNAEMLDKMLGNTVKIFQDYQRIQNELEKDRATDGDAFGGAQESAAERGIL